MIEQDSAINQVVEQLSERVRLLEQRVSVLEHKPEQAVSPMTPRAPGQKKERPPETWQGFPSLVMPSAAPVVGKAVLGMAGAYLFRAFAESSSLPKAPVLAFAVAYAGLWMFWAVRAHTDGFRSITFAITSALIIAPMLWETTIHFQFLSPAVSGLILIAYLALTLAQTWRLDLHAIPWLAAFVVVATALALLLATRSLVLLTITLIVFTLITELSAVLEHHTGLRVVTGLAADAAVWLTLYVMNSGTGVPEGYQAIPSSTQVALVILLASICVGSIGYRCFVSRKPITSFDIVQGVVVLFIATFGALRLPPGAFAPVLGVTLLILAAGCYWATLSRFADDTYQRNRRISAMWAAVLLVVGSYLAMSQELQVVFLSLAAVATTFAYARTLKASLALHASFYLGAAAVFSALLEFVMDALARTVPSIPGWEIWVVSAAAGICYFVGARVQQSTTRARGLWVLSAALLGLASVSVTVAVIASLSAGHLELSAPRLSVLRTIVNCLLALTFAVLGARFKRVELNWVAYAAVGFGTLKLVFEDLRIGNASTLVVSLLFYGLVLIVLPRLLRRGRTNYATQ